MEHMRADDADAEGDGNGAGEAAGEEGEGECDLGGGEDNAEWEDEDLQTSTCSATTHNKSERTQNRRWCRSPECRRRTWAQQPGPSACQRRCTVHNEVAQTQNSSLENLADHLRFLARACSSRQHTRGRGLQCLERGDDGEHFRPLVRVLMPAAANQLGQRLGHISGDLLALALFN